MFHNENRARRQYFTILQIKANRFIYKEEFPLCDPQTAGPGDETPGLAPHLHNTMSPCPRVLMCEQQFQLKSEFKFEKVERSFFGIVWGFQLLKVIRSVNPFYSFEYNFFHF